MFRLGTFFILAIALTACDPLHRGIVTRKSNDSSWPCGNLDASVTRFVTTGEIGLMFVNHSADTLTVRPESLWIAKDRYEWKPLSISLYGKAMKPLHKRVMPGDSLRIAPTGGIAFTFRDARKKTFHVFGEEVFSGDDFTCRLDLDLYLP